ncbi:MAG: hypothetical protein KTR30_14835 [Saprospiraceae bacterium]|nr:hypothetical protein [Saprospiraceae bacterium]
MTQAKLLAAGQDRRVVLSITWIFVLMNMIYADILNTMKPGYLAELEYVSTELSGELVLLFAILMEISIIMIPLSRFMGRKGNRMIHLVAVPLCILWVVVPSVLSAGTPLSYIFFATVEVLAMLFALYCAWTWPVEEVEPGL